MTRASFVVESKKDWSQGETEEEEEERELELENFILQRL